ncbi:MAG: response regulator [bacterium]|nr:response regulator [bacterium]
MLSMCPGVQYAHDLHHHNIPYIVDAWTTDDGLPQNYIADVLQTGDGYIWIGSQIGLVRFNGKTFHQFDSSNTKAMTTNYVKTLLEDRQGTLWIGTIGGGLVRLRNRKFEPFAPGKDLEDLQVNSLTNLPDGSIAVSTRGKGVYIIKDEKMEHFAMPPHLTVGYVRTLQRDRHGNTWIGTNSSGLIKAANGTFGSYTKKDGLPGSRVNAIHQDREGNLWIGTMGGLCRYNYGDDSFEMFAEKSGISNYEIRAIHEDADGNIWFGSSVSGLIRYRQGAFTTFGAECGLLDSNVTSITSDREGSLWIGTGLSGLNRFRERKITVLNTHAGLAQATIYPIIESPNNTVYIGSTARGGVNRLKKGKITTMDIPADLSNSLILSLFIDKEGALWIGAYGEGLCRYKDGVYKRFTTAEGLSSNFVYCVYGDSSGVLWIGTDGSGLNRFANGEFTVYNKANGLAHDRVVYVLEDSRKDLWCCTHGGGLSRIRNGKITTFDEKSGLSSNLLYLIYEDKKGVLWVGTSGGGLNRFKDGRFTPIMKKNGLFGNEIFSILEDDYGYFWFGSTNGIFQVSRQQLQAFANGKIERVASMAYGESDGMVTTDCSHLCQPAACKTRDGKLWFPTVRGIAIIDPADTPRNLQPPPVVIEKVHVDTEPKALGNLVIAPGSKSIEIHYAGLSFIDPGKVRYRYRLEGFEDKWLEAGTRAATHYANLPPGSYRFLVRACNNNGVWNNTGASLSFTLEPYFYQTLWFQLLCGLLVILLGFYIYRRRSRRLERREREHMKREEELEALVASRTTQLKTANNELEELLRSLREANTIAQKERKTADAANQAKSEFLARMSHEIRTPMNSVIGFTEILTHTELGSEQRDFVETISRSSEALVTIIDDILDFSKIEAGQLNFETIDFDPEVTAFDVCDLVRPRIGERPVEVLCRIGNKVPAYIRHDAGRFRQVLVNLMGNAAKFTEKGEIELSVNVEEEEETRLKILCKVRDTGIGIKPEQLESIFEVFQQADGTITRRFGGTGLGLAICKQIAEHMGGEISAESTPGKGSTFSFSAWVDKSKKSLREEPLMKHLSGKRILIADDNANNLEILEHILTHYSMSVVKLPGGTGVIDALHENIADKTAVDLCILDARMPDIDGLELAAQIRKLDSPIATIPLLAFSSSVKPRKEYKDFGFDGFLPKPVQTRKLLRMIELLLVLDKSSKEENAEDDILISQHTIVEDFKHSAHILLVEDNPVNRKLAKFLLTKAGYHLEMVQNGAEAVETYCSAPNKYDLIFMDIQMPEMDGREASKVIRGKGFTDIPIIAMTAESMDGDKEKCFAAGMNDYISKPIRREIVFGMINKWIVKK